MSSKVCHRCEKEFPRNSEYFIKDNRNKEGLGAWCKKCSNEYKKKYRKNKIIKCKKCGKDVHRKTSEIYCPDCRKDAYKENATLKKREYRASNKNDILKKEQLWRDTHKKEIKERSDRFYVKHRERISKREKKRRKVLRLQIFNHYCNGDIKCVCCEEKHIEFLCLDHIDGKGNDHRREIKKNSTQYYRWIINNNFPKILQVLCHNCNMAKAFYGYCPHELSKITKVKTKYMKKGEKD